MIDFRPILFIIGILLSTTALAMLLPAVADAAVGNPGWQVFAVSSGFTLFLGGTLMLTAQTRRRRSLTIRQAFVLTTLSWIVIPAVGALPLSFGDIELSYTDAFFEAMSGITTTGSTVIIGLDRAPPGILLWRSLLQWLGGIGVIAMAIAILPMLRVGGMQLFRMESSDRSDKVLPRAGQLVAYIGFIYVGFTGLVALGYWLAGMSGFDAICHAMTTVATAGFSTRDASLGHFDSAAVDAVATTGMLLGSLPFVLYLRALRGNPGALWRDSQVHWFFGMTFSVIAALTIYLYFVHDMAPIRAFRFVSLNVVSVFTGTGYVTTDYGTWGPFAVACFFFITFIGGCAGSTTCAIKVFRFQVMYATARAQMRRLLQPHGVFIAYYNGRPIPEDVSESVMSFFFLYAVCFALLAMALGLVGLDFVTAVSGAATAISNVGPGLGPTIGPAGTFNPLPDSAKWLLSVGMLLGRLELFTVLVLLAPGFWRP